MFGSPSQQSLYGQPSWNNIPTQDVGALPLQSASRPTLPSASQLAREDRLQLERDIARNARIRRDQKMADASEAEQAQLLRQMDRLSARQYGDTQQAMGYGGSISGGQVIEKQPMREPMVGNFLQAPAQASLGAPMVGNVFQVPPQASYGAPMVGNSLQAPVADGYYNSAIGGGQMSTQAFYSGPANGRWVWRGDDGNISEPPPQIPVPPPLQSFVRGPVSYTMGGSFQAPMGAPMGSVQAPMYTPTVVAHPQALQNSHPSKKVEKKSGKRFCC